MKVLVIYNPHAGGGRARRLLSAIRQRLAEKAIDAEFLLTDARGHGITLTELVPDGEILGRSPAPFECLPGAVRFLWP